MSRNREKDVMHPPGVEPGPIAWKAIILPLDQECLMNKSFILLNILTLEILSLDRCAK